MTIHMMKKQSCSPSGLKVDILFILEGSKIIPSMKFKLIIKMLSSTKTRINSSKEETSNMLNTASTPSISKVLPHFISWVHLLETICRLKITRVNLHSKERMRHRVLSWPETQRIRCLVETKVSKPSLKRQNQRT